MNSGSGVTEINKLLGGTQAPRARCLTRFGMIRGFYKGATATALAACKGPRCDAGPASGQGPDDTESRDNTKAGQGYSGGKGTRSGMMQARTQKVNGLAAATRLQKQHWGSTWKRTGSAQSASLLSEKITPLRYTVVLHYMQGPGAQRLLSGAVRNAVGICVLSEEVRDASAQGEE